MSDKNTTFRQRDELAAHLESVAAQIRSGEITVDNRRWSVPDGLAFKTKMREKHGRLSVKMSFSWPSLGDYTAEERRRVTRRQQHLKTIKRRMTTSFRILDRAVRDGRLPKLSQLADFEATVDEFAKQADPEWSAAMAAFRDHFENLKRAVDGGQLEIAAHELRDLKSREKACHKAFK